MQKKLTVVKTLLESIPYIKEFSNQIVVIKYGGAAQVNPVLKEQFAIDLLLMYLVGIKPIIIHGGGKRISELLSQLDITTKFVDGIRFTDEKSLKIVEMVLAGEINKELTAFLNHHGAKAIGLCGKDAGFFKAKPYKNGELGYVGEITDIKSEVITNLVKDGFIPVIAPIAIGESANHPGYNINADTCASAIAGAIGAMRVIFLTDTPGVMDSQKNLLPTLTREEVGRFIYEGVIEGGMIPKVEACLSALSSGVQKAHIIDGRIEHSILLELFTDEGIGTQILKDN
ncbi:MAG: acetylglutamate kinase [Campylobacterales bacterium]